MNRTKRYEKTVDLLLDAYNTGNLEHGSCSACAVGNICQGLNGWQYYFYTSRGIRKKTTPIFNSEEKEKEEFDKLFPTIGYTIEELADIEHAFETSINKDRERLTTFDKKLGQMIGLKAVFGVLKEIHSTEPEIVENNEVRLKETYEKVIMVR